MSEVTTEMKAEVAIDEKEMPIKETQITSLESPREPGETQVTDPTTLASDIVQVSPLITAALADKNVKGIIGSLDNFTSKIVGSEPTAGDNVKETTANIVSNIEKVAGKIKTDKDINNIKNNIVQLLGKFGINMNLIETEQKDPMKIEVLREAGVSKSKQVKLTKKEKEINKYKGYILNLLVVVYVIVTEKILPDLKVQFYNHSKSFLMHLIIHLILVYFTYRLFLKN